MQQTRKKTQKFDILCKICYNIIRNKVINVLITNNFLQEKRRNVT